MSDSFEILQAKYNALSVEAERHKTIADSLNFASVELRRKLSQVEQENASLKQSDHTRLQTIDSLGKVISKFEADKSELENKIEELNIVISEKNVEIRNLASEKDLLLIEKDQIQTLLETNNRNNSENQIENIKLQKVIEEIEKDKQQIIADYENKLIISNQETTFYYENKIKALNDVINELDNQLRNTLEALNIVREEMEEKQATITMLYGDINTGNDLIQHHCRTISDLHEQISNLRQANETLQLKIDEMEATAKRNLLKHHASVEDYQNAYRDCRTQLEAAQRSIQDGKDEIAAVSKQLCDTQSDYSILVKSFDDRSEELHNVRLRLSVEEGNLVKEKAMVRELEESLQLANKKMDGYQDEVIDLRTQIEDLSRLKLALEDDMFELQRSFEDSTKLQESQFSDKLSALTAQYEEEVAVNKTLTTELATVKDTLEKTETELREKIATLERSLQQETDKYKNLILLMDDRERSRVETGNALQALQTEAAADRKDLAQLRLKHAADKETISTLKEEVSRLTDLATAQRESLETHIQEIVRLEIQRQRQDAIVRDTSTELESLRERNAVLESQLVDFNNTEEFKRQIEMLTNDLKSRDEDYETLNNVHRRIKSRQEDLEKFIADKNTEIRELQAQNRELYRKLADPKIIPVVPSVIPGAGLTTPMKYGSNNGLTSSQSSSSIASVGSADSSPGNESLSSHGNKTASAVVSPKNSIGDDDRHNVTGTL